MTTSIETEVPSTYSKAESGLNFSIKKLQLSEITPEDLQSLTPCNYFHRLGSDHPNFFPWELKLGISECDLYQNLPNFYDRNLQKSKLSESEKKTLRYLKEKNIDAPVLTFRDVPDTELIVLRVPKSTEELNHHGDKLISQRIVGCILDGEIIDASIMERKFRMLISERNQLLRSSQIRERLMRLEPEEAVDLFRRGSRAHKLAILVGFLAGYGPHEAYFEVIKDNGMVKIGSLECGKNETPIDIEIALPPFQYNFNLYTNREDERKSQLPENKLLHLAALGRKQLRDAIYDLAPCDSLRVEERIFMVAHRWEGKNFCHVVVSCSREDQNNVFDALEKLSNEIHSHQ